MLDVVIMDGDKRKREINDVNVSLTNASPMLRGIPITVNLLNILYDFVREI